MARGWKVDRWRVVGLALIVIGASLLYMAVRHGWSDEGLRGAIRVTARSSLFLFLAAFSASSLMTFVPTDSVRWLLENRRFFGIAFAFSHLIHGAAIITLATRTGGASLTARVIGLGSAGVLYGFILFMLATSFDRTAAWVGACWWKRIHTLGSNLVFVSFLATYARKATESLAFLPYTLLLLAVLGLRMARRIRNRS